MADKKTKAEKGAEANAPHPVTPASAEAEPTVTISVTLPRFYRIPLLKDAGAEVTRDLAEVTPDAAKHLLAYGLGRFNRDGATPDDKVDSGEKGADGKPVMRDATADERKVEAIKLSDEKWTRLIAGTLRQRIGGVADPVLSECRTLVVKALVKRNVARKAIPKLPDYESMTKACAAFEGLFSKCKALAEKVVAARGSEDI